MLLTKLAPLLLLTALASANVVDITSLNTYVHYDGALQATLDPSSTSLDANGFGSFSFYWENDTGGPVTSVTLDLFLDAFLDSDQYNELGEFDGLTLSALAPSGAIAPTHWEIDEPSYFCGDIYYNATSATGQLDDQNYVPCVIPPDPPTPDDLSQALQFDLGPISAGDSVTITGNISLEAIGLKQTDVDTGDSFHLNAWAVATAPTVSAPEPGSFGLCAVMLLAIYLKKGLPR